MPRCFMHIPKSGGSSVATALERAAPIGAVAPKWVDGAMLGEGGFDMLAPIVRAGTVNTEADVEALRQFDFVSGHFTLGTLERVASPGEITTTLREPRARLLSAYGYWRWCQRAVGATWGEIDPQRHALRPLAEFLGEAEIATATDQVVARYVLWGDPRLPREGWTAVDDVPALAADVIARLERLAHVAIVDADGADFAGLSAALGLELPDLHVNVTAAEATRPPPGAAPVAPDDTAIAGLLEDRTAVDQLVYRHFAAQALGSERAADDLATLAYAEAWSRFCRTMVTIEGVGAPLRSGPVDGPALLHDAPSPPEPPFPDADVFELETQVVLLHRQISVLSAALLRSDGDVAHRDAVIAHLQLDVVALRTAYEVAIARLEQQVGALTDENSRRAEQADAARSATGGGHTHG